MGMKPQLCAPRSLILDHSWIRMLLKPGSIPSRVFAKLGTPLVGNPSTHNALPRQRIVRNPDNSRKILIIPGERLRQETGSQPICQQ